MIISSAIKFFIEKTGKEVILCGRRHGDIFMQLSLLGFKPRKGYKEVCQGFITDKGDFLTREQAFEHAKQCGQISSVLVGKSSCELFSEILW